MDPHVLTHSYPPRRSSDRRNPPQDGSAPGIFYINLADMKAQPRYQLAATLYHEAIPGHHIETCIAHEMEGIPKFRRFASYAAFSAGRGLYSELLPTEMGLYADHSWERAEESGVGEECVSKCRYRG